MKRCLIPLIQILITVALLGWFFHDEEFRTNTSRLLSRANPLWILAGIAIAGVENLIGAFRWRIFLHALDIQLPIWKTIQICLVALFCNTFLLGAVGGDLIRAAFLIRRGESKVRSLLSVVMDRMAGLFALIGFTAVLTIANREWLFANPAVTTTIQLVLAYQAVSLAVILFTLWLATHDSLNRLPHWLPKHDLIRHLAASYARLRTNWGSTLLATGLSLLMIIGLVGVFFSSARAFGSEISFIHLASVIPFVDMIAALPISVGGIGVREQVFVHFLGKLAAVPPATAFSISFGGFLLNNSWGLVGACLLPFFRGIIRDARKASV